MKEKNQRPLLLIAGTTYVAADFLDFDYSGAALTGSKAILHLRMKNGSIVDLPTSDDALKDLLHVLMEAFPVDARNHARERGWAV